MADVASMASDVQVGPVASHFDCLDIRNAMLPLNMLSSLCDAGDSGVTGPKKCMLQLILIVLI